MRILRAALLLALIALHSCSGGGRVSDLADAGWSDARRDSDTRILRLLGDEQYMEVIRLADSIETASGTDPRLKGQKAEALWRTGGVEEATTLFEESLLEDYAVCETHLNFAVMLLETGKTGRALTELNEAKMFCGLENTALINRNLAVVRLRRGEEEAALAAVEEGLGYAKEDPYLLGMKGMLIAEANPVLAETLFVRSERGGGMTPDFQYQLGLLLLRSGQPSRAVRPLGAAAAAAPDDMEIRFNYAESLARSGRQAQAEEVLRTMLGDDPDGRATRRLARLLFRRDDFAGALELFRRLPETPENLDRVAMSLHRLGRTDEAIGIQRGVVRDRPEWPTALINLAVMLGSVGELGEAERLLVRALELDPENVTATVNLENLRRVRRETGR